VHASTVLSREPDSHMNSSSDSQKHSILVSCFSDQFNPLTLIVAVWVQLAIKDPVPNWVKPSFVIFDIWGL